MLDLNVNISIDTDKLGKQMNQKAFAANDDKFSKVLNEANKSFEASKNAIEKQEKDDKSVFKKMKNKLEEKDDSSQEQSVAEKNKAEEVSEDNIKKEEEDSSEKKPEKVENKIENEKNVPALEQLLFNYQNKLSTREQRNQFKDVRDLRTTSDKLLQQREQTLEMTAQMLDKLKMPQSASQTATKLQGQIANQLQNSFLSQPQQGVAVSSDAVLNLQNTLNAKLGNTTPMLADALAELKVEISAIKTDAPQADSKGFDFNSSSFSNLDSHITKLNLNKGVDFAKVMGQKVAQEQQILNQVREGTQNLGKGSSQVNIVLRPESLGRINVHISSANGAVTAQFTAQSQQAADALSRNIDALRQSLAEHGVKVSEVSVKVQETSQSDTFADARNFDEGKLNSSKENNSNKNTAHKSGAENSNAERQYAENVEMDEIEEDVVSTVSSKNDNLGIYNNMGRKV